jgi:hypothetical protein
MNKLNFNKTYVLFILIFICSIYNLQAQSIAINELLTTNKSTISDEDDDFEDWIEIYNYGTTSINLEGFGLSDDESIPHKWIFPERTIKPKEYIIIWASEKNRSEENEPLHTNFKLSSSGEVVILSDANENILNTSPKTVVSRDRSYGRSVDGTGSWTTFNTPTPKLSNTTIIFEQELDAPEFSHESGLYPSNFNLEITSEENGATIVYTLDGSEPDINNTAGTIFEYKNSYPNGTNDPFGPLLQETYISTVYSAPILVKDNSGNPDKLASKNSVQDDIYTPPNPVRKTFIIKAKVFRGNENSPTVARTFFVWPSGNPYKLPIVSIQTEESNLFDYNKGVYTAGVDFDTWREENPNNKQAYKPEHNNFWRRGLDWEYPANVQIFEQKLLSPVLNLNAGFRIDGESSRGKILKALKLYARNVYDEKNSFEYNLFEQNIPGAIRINNFKRILLRGNGSGDDIALDAAINNIMQPMFNGITRIKNAVHFINGEYWGITAIRDSFDKYHFANNFNLEEDNIIIIDCDKGKCVVNEGNEEDFNTYNVMKDYIYDNDLSIAANYAEAEKLLDMDSFINHMVLTIFVANDRFESSYWRARNPINAEFGDGKWRLTISDFDSSLKDNNFLNTFTEIDTDDDNSFFGKLLKNEDFKNKFINRFADLLNSGFNVDRFKAVTNATFDEIIPLLPEDINRSIEREEDFYDESTREDLLEWIDERHPIIKNEIQNLFTLAGQVDIQLNVSNKNTGYIQINTIPVKSTTAGIMENPYPWSGVYFKGVPITLEAKTLPGATFSNWSGDISSTNPIISVTPTENLNIVANYNQVINESANLIYFWLFDDSLQNEIPLEEVDVSYARNGLSASLNFKSALAGYPFAKNNSNFGKATLTKDNSSTAINYSPEANQNKPFGDDIVRGIQITQPFKVDNLENTVELNFPTSDFEKITLKLAVKSDGAADVLIVDYWNGIAWSSSNLIVSSSDIERNYELKEFDFSNVPEANNKENFKIRIRFDGNDMFDEDDDTVILNNISVEGESTAVTLSATDNEILSNLKIFPNPTENNIKVLAEKNIERVTIYNLFGQKLYDHTPDSFSHQINLEKFSTGVYFLTVYSENQKKTTRIVKN